MTTPQDQDCPLCQTPAKFKFVDSGNRKLFFCTHCTQFLITLRAEERISNGPQQWQDEYSETAKRSNDETILDISSPSSGQVPDGVASTALHGEFVLRSKTN